MNFRITTAKALTRKMKTQIFLRWFFYALVLLFSYSLMSCGAFKAWQPYLIISLSIAVGMCEQEVSSSVFGIICGFFLDIATGSLFGFHALLLMPLCMLTSLLSRNLIKVNYFNHIIFTAVSSALVFLTAYIFKFLIWSQANSEIVLLRILLPSFIATVLTAPVVFFVIRFIAVRFGLKEANDLSEAVEEIVEDEKQKNNKNSY